MPNFEVTVVAEVEGETVQDRMTVEAASADEATELVLAAFGSAAEGCPFELAAVAEVPTSFPKQDK